MSDETVTKAREAFRAENISAYYSGPLHLTTTVTVSLAVVALCIASLDSVSLLEWITLPITFLYANLVEYLGHKGPMHNRTKFFGLIYKRHAIEHHSFFTEEATTFDSSKDYKAVLFPPIMLFFFFGCFALPVGGALYVLLSPNVAFLFVLTAAAYFLNYELLHFCYHIDERAWPSKFPFMNRLRRHHTIHHDKALMAKFNFNISYPIFDAVFGTMYKGI